MKNLIVQFPTDCFIKHLESVGTTYRIISMYIPTREIHYIEVPNYKSKLKKKMLIGNCMYYE